MNEVYVFKVNGVEITSERQSISALDILRLAKEKDAVPGEPETYVLQGEKRQYEGGAFVDLEQDSLFIAIPTKPTPVA